MNNSVNYLWLDGETTGLDNIKNDIIQLACVPVIDGITHSTSFNQYCQPINWNEIDNKALQVNNITIAQLKQCQSPHQMVDNLVTYLKQFNTKFTIAGYNVEFDRGFISSLFQKVGRERDFANLFTSDIRDVYKRAKKLKSQLPTPNIKLSTLCDHFGIAINAHDALSDILATEKLDKVLSEMLGDKDIPVKNTQYVIDDSLSFPEPAQLHCHSRYSYTDSLPSIKEWTEWCISTNTPGFSVVDHGNAAALFEISKVKDVIGIPGTGLHVELNGSLFYLNAWATSEEGYRNIIKLSSLGWENRTTISGVEFPTLKDIELIKKYSSGIVFGLPGVNGPVTSFLESRQYLEAEQVVSFLSSNLDIRLELAAVDIYKKYDGDIGFCSYNVEEGNIQKAINKFYWDMAKKYKLQCVPVVDAHFINPEDKIVVDCLSKNSFDDNRYFFETRNQITSNRMFAILENHIGIKPNEYLSLVMNTHEIMNKAANISIKHDYHLPKINIPEYIKAKTSDYNEQTYYYTMQLIKKHGRWNDSPEYIERFKKEIDVIMKNSTLNFLPYFLVYEDVCHFARSCGFMQGIARGSAGGSLLSFYLKIIHIDPVATNLPFERFLSHARIRAGSFPDIDLDIADKARPLVMQYLKDTYGLGFAQIATFSTMKTKNAIKDAMWALYGRHRKDPEVAAVCDAIDDSPQGVDEYDFLYGYVDQEGEEHTGEISKKEILANFFKNKPEVETMVQKLIGSIRGWSRHASAFVISTLDLSGDRVPTMVMDDKELGTIYVTQYDASMVEKSGLVKADILGVKTLTMASDAIKLIKENHGVDFLEEENGVSLIYRLPNRDKGVFADFYNRDTESSFQFNTELIKGFAREFAPTCREDLAAMTALCRPGALDAPFEDTTATKFYMDVRNGNRNKKYIHPDLEPILSESNGVFCIAEDQDVLTKTGLKKIQDISMGDMVKTEDGSWQKVLLKVNNGTKKILRIMASNGAQLKCTPDHKILTNRGWIEAQDLTKNDLIKSFWMSDESRNTGSLKDWFFGLLLADGNLTASTINVACSSEEFAEKVVALSKEAFGLESPYSTKRGNCWYAVLRHKPAKSGFFSKDYEPNPVMSFLKERGALGKDCYTKTLNLAHVTLQTLIGFIEGDGCLATNRIRLCNRDLAYSLFLGFQAHRIPSSFEEKQGVYIVSFHDYESKLSYRIKTPILKKITSVYVPRSFLPKLSKKEKHHQHTSGRRLKIPFVSKFVADQCGVKCHDLWSKVLRVEDLKEECVVYDLSVESVHSFVVGGHVVHNCYQEEIMKFLVDIVGYSWEESDLIRSAIAKKKHEVIMDAFKRIRVSCKERGWTEEQIEIICQQVQAFSRYSFNKSHSWAYGEFGYITLYLKHHYKFEWWSSVLNNEDKEDRIRRYISYLGDIIASPSIKDPMDGYTIKGDKLIAPISAIKGVGPAVVKEVLAKGPFKDLKDYVERVDHTKANIGSMTAFIKSRAADTLMDESIPEYIPRREKFMKDYLKYRKAKSVFKEEMYKVDPISIFLDEKNINQSFNKHLLLYEGIGEILEARWPALRPTGRLGIPYVMGDANILASVKVAEGFLKKGLEQEVGMILLFEGSDFKQGISKKGKPYSKLDIHLSDGFSTIECTDWNRKQALNWPKNTIVYVRGKLKPGWKMPVGITISEIEKVEKGGF